MSEENPRLAEGVLLGGKYRVERKLGQGGMGVVVLAHHEELDQRVAIKVLDKESADAEVVARFMREARAAAKLQSDHVVRVTDVGRFDGVGPYMVMEYLKGDDLSGVLGKRGALPPAEAVDVILEALDALAEAHSIGIVHRDIKPSNLFVAERTDGSRITKVLDFGISKVDAMSELAAGKQHLTSTSTVMGSPAYMSPEQLKSSRDVDARADVWSIGVVLYELLTARLPFQGETVGALFTSIVSEPPTAMAAPLVPRGLEEIVLRCLQRDPNARPANVGELARALAPFGSGRASRQVERADSLTKQRASVDQATRIKPLGSIPDGAPSDHAQTQRSWQTLAPASVRNPLALAIAAGVLVAIGIAITFLVLRTKEPDRPAVAASSPSPTVTITPTASSSIAIAPLQSTQAPPPSVTPKVTTIKPSTQPSTTAPSFLDRRN